MIFETLLIYALITIHRMRFIILNSMFDLLILRITLFRFQRIHEIANNLVDQFIIRSKQLAFFSRPLRHDFLVSSRMAP